MKKLEDKKNLYGYKPKSSGKNKKKFSSTLSQTFKDSEKYKKIDDGDFFNTNNFIGTKQNNNSKYYNTSQEFYKPNQKEMNENNNKLNINNRNNNINNNNNNYNNNMNSNKDDIINNENIDYNKLEDKEILIRELLNDYKLKLNNELFNFIESEEKKEKERIIIYHNTSINKKEEIKKQLAEERANSAMMISQKTEENERKYKEFENEIRQKFNL